MLNPNYPAEASFAQPTFAGYKNRQPTIALRKQAHGGVGMMGGYDWMGKGWAFVASSERHINRDRNLYVTCPFSQSFFLSLTKWILSNRKIPT
jgi:hypothetical protein